MGFAFPPEVERAAAYPAPGVWMPTLPANCIRLSAGYPYPDSIPAQDLLRSAATTLAQDGDLALQYLNPGAMLRLPEWLAARSAQRGMPVAAGELMVTAGAFQALDLAARTLIAPGDVVAVEAPTYMEALEVMRNYTPDLISYPVDSDGLQTDALAEDLRRRRRQGAPIPKLLYTVASFHNPSGALLSQARRLELLRLAEEFDFNILEDDAYGELSFGAPPATLRSLGQPERVIYLGSLSKTVAPGLRIGWAVGPPPLIERMQIFKKDLDHAFIWSLAACYLETFDWDSRLAALRQEYQRRAGVLTQALAEHMPREVRWSEPKGGFFIWVELPDGFDTGSMLKQALDAGVAYLPGHHFYWQANKGRNYLRLSYSYVADLDMQRGVQLLVDQLNRFGNERVCP